VPSRHASTKRNEYQGRAATYGRLVAGRNLKAAARPPHPKSYTPCLLMPVLSLLRNRLARGDSTPRVAAVLADHTNFEENVAHFDALPRPGAAQDQLWGCGQRPEDALRFHRAHQPERVALFNAVCGTGRFSSSKSSRALLSRNINYFLAALCGRCSQFDRIILTAEMSPTPAPDAFRELALIDALGVRDDGLLSRPAIKAAETALQFACGTQRRVRASNSCVAERNPNRAAFRQAGEISATRVSVIFRGSGTDGVDCGEQRVDASIRLAFRQTARCRDRPGLRPSPS